MPRPMTRRICVFCGSSSGARRSYADAATSLARYLAGKEIAVVYGGGNVGLMGTLADAVLEAGGDIIVDIRVHLDFAKVAIGVRLSRLRTLEEARGPLQESGEAREGIEAAPPSLLLKVALDAC